jgi:hypothetical protein
MSMDAALTSIDDLLSRATEGGMLLSQAMARHPQAFDRSTSR